MIFRVALASLALLLWGCSSGPKLDPNTAEGSFALAEKYEKDERFEDAIAQFSQVKNKHPYSSLAVASELKIADIHFKREDYIEAQAAYQTFKELHPSHAKIDYVTYQLGMSFFHQLPATIDRDLSVADKALLYFDEVITSYPRSAYVKESQDYKEKILHMLAEKELYIANFYFIRKKYDSALGRFEGLIQNYPASSFAAKALKGAAISAHRLNDNPKAQSFLSKLAEQFAGSDEWREAKEEIGNGH